MKDTIHLTASGLVGQMIAKCCEFCRTCYSDMDGGRIKFKISKLGVALRCIAVLCLIGAVSRTPQGAPHLVNLQLPRPEPLQRICQFWDVNDFTQEPFPRVCERNEIVRMGYVTRSVEAAIYVLAVFGAFVIWKILNKTFLSQNKVHKENVWKNLAIASTEQPLTNVTGSGCMVPAGKIEEDCGSDSSLECDPNEHVNKVGLILWLFLAIVGLIVYPSRWAARISVISVLWDMLVAHHYLLPKRQSQDRRERELQERHHWSLDKEQSLWRSAFPDEGKVMAKVLIPILLLATTGRRVSATTHHDDAFNYSELSAFALLIDDGQMGRHAYWVLSVPVAVGAALSPSVWDNSGLLTMQGVAFLVLAWSLRRSIRLFAPGHRVFTEGEWTLVSFFTSIAIIQVMTWRNVEQEDMHSFFALSIVMGCILACAVTSYMRRLPVYARLLVMTAITTAIAEILVQDRGRQGRGEWQRLRFLSEVEVPPHWAAGSILYRILPMWPRYCWFSYGATVLATSLTILAIKARPGMRTGTAHATTSALFGRKVVVIERKYFHLISMAIFPPMVVMAPQLMSLYSAIFLTALLFVEVVRPDMQIVDRFYGHFLDPFKERGGGRYSTDSSCAEDGDHAIMFSHIVLVFGSVAPMWIAEYANDSHTGWLPLFGVICVGVGDAVGAVTGVVYGEPRWWWGREGRTMEGSMAMLVSMLLTGYLLIGAHDNDTYDNFVTIMVSVYVTVLEAYTSQMDNIVLPLAGATLLLLSHQLKALHFQPYSE